MHIHQYISNFIVMLFQEYIRREVKPTNKDQLVDGIRQFWGTVSVAKCRRYISHLNKVLPAIIEVGGEATGY